MFQVVKYVPVMLDRDNFEFPSLTLIADSERQARENARMAHVHRFSGRLAEIKWETPHPEQVTQYDNDD